MKHYRLSWMMALLAAITFALPLAGFSAAPKGASMTDTTHASGAAGGADTAVDTGAGHAGGGHGAAPLLPSTAHEAQEFFLTPAIWTIVIFLIMLIILYPMAWKPVLAGLKAREKRIRDDIAGAEASRKRAEATLQEYDAKLASAQSQIREMLAKAQADGEQLATSIRMTAQKEAEEAKDRAMREIDASKNAAVGEIYNQAAELATNIASKILRRNLNADDQKQLVRESLDQLQTIK
ncbi:MAG: F0F1 ATP synthase subunit B [Anaerolineae bacterium]|nr:F0F1 ATP synthase subunit B [Phycisphaerae bacterium]